MELTEALCLKMPQKPEPTLNQTPLTATPPPTRTDILVGLYADFQELHEIRQALNNNSMKLTPKLKEQIYMVQVRSQIGKVILSGMPQQVEVKEELKVEEKHVTVIADYTGAIEAAVKRDIQSLRAEQQMDTAQTDNQTS